MVKLTVALDSRRELVWACNTQKQESNNPKTT